MKIAICTDMYLPQLGGVADSIVLQASGLRSLGHDVRIFAPNMRGSEKDLNVVRFPTIEMYGGTFCLVNPFGVSAALEAYAPDVVHVHSFGILALAAQRAARSLGIPAVGTNHGSPLDYLHYFFLDFEPFRFLISRYVAMFYSGFAVVTTPSDHPMRLLRRSGMQTLKTQIVSNAVDSSLFKKLDDKQTLKARIGIEHRAVLIFGRLAREKNIEEALIIFAQVADRTHAQLVVIGDGPERSALEKCARRLKIADRTFFMGRMSGEPLVAAINACDVMLMTSPSEAQPMTILQANLCGVPVVGARAGGIPECIHDGETGYLVDIGNRESFANHVSRLISDESLAHALGSAAHERAASKTPLSIARIWERLYRTLPGVL